MPTPSLVQMISSDANYYQAGVPTNGIQNNFRYNVANYVQAGNAYLISATWPDGNPPTLSDNLNGVWPAPIGTVGVGQGNNVSGFFLLIGSLPGWMTITARCAGNPSPPWQWNVKEFCHIIGSGGTAAGSYAQTGPTLTAGSFTPSNNNSGGGNLVVTYCCSSGANMVTTSQPSSITPASGHTLLEANITCIEVQASGGYGFAHAEEYYLQTTAGAINPGFTATGDTTNTYNVIAIALTVGPAGSPAPSYGPWINKIIHQSTRGDAALTSIKFQVPWTGNLRFARALTGGNLASLTITDSDSYTWSNEASATGDLVGFAANTTADTNATLTFGGTAGSFSNGYTWVFYDMANMATSPFDQFVSSTAYNQTNGGIPSNATTLINVPSITPGVNCGICISATGLGTGPGLTCSSPQGAIDDFIHYSGEDDNDNYDNADCGGHIVLGTDATINWCYTLTPGAGYTDGSYAITFAAATLPSPTSSSGSGAVSSFRDPDVAIHGWFNKTLIPGNEWFDQNQPEPATSSIVALVARMFAAITGRASNNGTATLSARGEVGLKSHSVPYGNASLSARSSADVSARGAVAGSAALAAKTAVQVKGSTNPLYGTAGLASRATIAVKSLAYPVGSLALAARTAIAVMERGAVLGTAPLVGAVSAKVKAFSAPIGNASLAARAAIKVMSRGALSASGAFTSMVSVGTIQFKVMGQLAGSAALSARSGLAAKARGALSASGALTSVISTGAIQFKALGQLAGVAALSARSGMMAKARSGFNGLASLSAIAHVAVRARSAPSAIVPLVGIVSAKVKGLSAPAGNASLAARAAMKVMSRGVFSAGGALTSVISIGAIQFKAMGRLAGSAALSARSGLMAKAASGFNGRASLSAVAQAAIRAGGAMAGSASLAARTAIQVVARGAVSGGGTLTSIMSMGAIQFKATAQLVRAAAVGITIKGRAAAAWFSGRAL